MVLNDGRCVMGVVFLLSYLAGWFFWFFVVCLFLFLFFLGGGCWVC